MNKRKIIIITESQAESLITKIIYEAKSLRKRFKTQNPPIGGSKLFEYIAEN